MSKLYDQLNEATQTYYNKRIEEVMSEPLVCSGWFRKKIGERKVLKWFKITIPTFSFFYTDENDDFNLMTIHFYKKIKLFPIGTKMENIYE